MAYPAVLSIVQTEWGLSSTAAGSISSAYQIGTAVALVFVSAAADYLDPRLVFRVSAGLTAAVSLLIPVLAHGHLSALLLFGAVAVAVAGIYTPGIMLLAERFEPARRGKAMGWFLAASSMGYVLALVVGGVMVARAGWRAALFVLALGPLLCFVLSLVLFHGERSRRVAQPAPRRVSFDADLSGNRPAQLMIWGYVFHSWELLGM
jgi:MFS family permease